MAAGWSLPSGDLSRFPIDMEKYWAHFNYVFSESSHKRSTYKFGLVKALIDCLYSMELTERGMELSYEKIFAKFTENYWNLIAKYKIRQIQADGKSNISKIEKLIYSFCDENIGASFIEYENLNTQSKAELVKEVTKECHRYVIGALYDDFKGELYGFNHQEQRLWIHLYAYKFIMTYKLEIEQMNYYAWARFLETINTNNPTINLLESLDRSTPKRNDLSIYRDILRDEFETNNCFYCGSPLSKLPRKTHVDHLLPWSFVKSDHLWNFVLSCDKCNSKKNNMLPTKQKLAEVVSRNTLLETASNPFIQKEMVGYTKDLMWNIWDYASRQGYIVYEKKAE